MQPRYGTRKPNRAPGFDYRSPGPYFVTIHVQDRHSLFDSVADDAVHLIDAGTMIAAAWMMMALHERHVEGCQPQCAATAHPTPCHPDRREGPPGEAGPSRYANSTCRFGKQGGLSKPGTRPCTAKSGRAFMPSSTRFVGMTAGEVRARKVMVMRSCDSVTNPAVGRMTGCSRRGRCSFAA